MRKNPISQSGIFNTRVVIAVALCIIGASLGFLSFASTPSSETLTDVSGPLTYTAGPFNVANQSPLGAGQLDIGPRCDSQFPCDSNALTVNIPATYLAANPNAFVKVTMFWTDTGSGQSDYDLYIFNGVVGNTTGAQGAAFQSRSSRNPEFASIIPLAAGPRQYTIKIVPTTPTQEIVNVRIELQAGPAGGFTPGPCDSTVFGDPDKTCVGNPRYQNFFAPAGSSAEASSGEFNIGFDPKTNRIMAMNAGPIWRLTPGEIQASAKPECCEALWEDKSSNVTNTGLDPILWTDRKSGRTYASNSTAGAIGSIYTDNDGDQWVPIASPPNGGADHQTFGSGPYPATLAALSTVANQGQYVLYCSQDLVGAFCQRSDDLGVNFGPGQSTTGNGIGSQGCGGLHGHAHIAPDGTAWLPDKSCTKNNVSKQGGAISLDAGTTPWTEFVVEKTVADADGPAFTTLSQGNGADPSIGIDSANTVYYAYVNNEVAGTQGHVHVAVGKRVGTTTTINWLRDVDVGATHGIINAAHTEAVGGDAGRAAVGFFGTNVAGNYQSGTFPGKWYAFIATTFDEGRTWVTVNATPDDPVQSMTGIWQRGGSGENGDRNLLDFNEITVDGKGRVLYGYSDGCSSPACIAGATGSNLGAGMRVARQFGGKSLFASFDPAEPAAPKPACLSGTRDPLGSHLTWKIPDNAGSDIVSYEIWRSTTTGTEMLLANTGSPAPKYNDTTTDPSVAHYFYVIKAINSVGTSLTSNEIDLVVSPLPPPESVCVLPGLTILTDPSGDLITPIGVTTNAGWDLRRLSIAEPFSFAPNKVVFTLKMENLTAVPPDTRWPVTFTSPNGKNYTVRMTNVATDGATTAPIFQVGTTAQTGAAAELFVSADPASNFNPDGTITMVVPTSAIGNPSPGQNLTGFLVRINANLGAAFITPDNMPSSLAPAGGYTVVTNNTCFPLPPGIVSRKAHGSAGVFDIDLPTSGNPGIECRSGGSSNAYTLVYTFGANLGFAGAATVTQGIATVGSTALGPNRNQVTVNLTNVANAQHLVVTLAAVQDAANVPLPSQVARMDVLLGDVNATGLVDGNDVSVVQGATRQAVASDTFREDVNCTGLIDGNDVSMTQEQTRASRPANRPVTNKRKASRAQ